MTNVNYLILNDSVILNFDGKTITIPRNDKRCDRVIDAIRSGQLDDIPGLIDMSKDFEGTGIELRDGLLWEGDTPLPDQLSKRVLAFREDDLPYDALLKFWENLKKNPSFNSRQQLFAFLEHNGHPLTEDGCFIAYRGVGEDFKDLHTGKYDNSPGKVVEMPRELVDDNPNNTCSSGLHVACFDYARGFGPKLIEVKVNPADVVAVPVDYNGTKMRTCKFEVVREGENMRNENLYGHETGAEAPKTDEELESQIDDEDDEIDEDKCSECGNEHDPFANFCSECGHEF